MRQQRSHESLSSSTSTHKRLAEKTLVRRRSIPNTRIHTSAAPETHTQDRVVFSQQAASQDAIFFTTAPIVLLLCIAVPLLALLRAHIREELLMLQPGVERTMIEQHVLLEWVNTMWPKGARGVYALVGVCVGVLAVLRAVIWAIAAVMKETTLDKSARNVMLVPVGTWEGGETVTAGEIFSSMFM